MCLFLNLTILELVTALTIASTDNPYYLRTPIVSNNEEDSKEYLRDNKEVVSSETESSNNLIKDLFVNEKLDYDKYIKVKSYEKNISSNDDSFETILDNIWPEIENIMLHYKIQDPSNLRELVTCKLLQFESEIPELIKCHENKYIESIAIILKQYLYSINKIYEISKFELSIDYRRLFKDHYSNLLKRNLNMAGKITHFENNRSGYMKQKRSINDNDDGLQQQDNKKLDTLDILAQPVAFESIPKMLNIPSLDCINGSLPVGYNGPDIQCVSGAKLNGFVILGLVVLCIIFLIIGLVMCCIFGVFKGLVNYFRK